MASRVRRFLFPTAGLVGWERGDCGSEHCLVCGLFAGEVPERIPGSSGAGERGRLHRSEVVYRFSSYAATGCGLLGRMVFAVFHFINTRPAEQLPPVGGLQAGWRVGDGCEDEKGCVYAGRD